MCLRKTRNVRGELKNEDSFVRDIIVSSNRKFRVDIFFKIYHEDHLIKCLISI